MTDLAQLLLSWCNSFKKGKDFDAWGQFVEAGDEYTRLSRQIKKQLAPANQFFTDEQKKILSKVAACLQMRSKSFQNLQAECISLEDLRQVYSVLENILSGKKETFPIKIEQTEQCNFQVECHLIAEDDFVKDQEDTRSGTLLARIPYEHNCHRLTITIVKIGLKEPWNYINPFITVSVKGLDGTNITSSQDTPVSKIKQANDIVFSCDVELQQVTEKLPKGTPIEYYAFAGNHMWYLQFSSLRLATVNCSYRC